jgi:hypothetical protein
MGSSGFWGSESCCILKKVKNLELAPDSLFALSRTHNSKSAFQVGPIHQAGYRSQLPGPVVIPHLGVWGEASLRS